MHALIIEDEALIATDLETLLADCGFTSFDFAVSSEEAIASAEHRCPDLITADVNLQPGNGIDAIQSICTGRTIPVIFVTSSGSEVRARMPGHPMLEKPVSGTAFKAAVDLAMTPQ